MADRMVLTVAVAILRGGEFTPDKDEMRWALASARAALEESHHEELVEALTLVEAGHEYKTPAGTKNCRFCDHNTDHEGTYEDMHAPDCMIHSLRTLLAKVEGNGHA